MKIAELIQILLGIEAIQPGLDVGRVRMKNEGQGSPEFAFEDAELVEQGSASYVALVISDPNAWDADQESMDSDPEDLADYELREECLSDIILQSELTSGLNIQTIQAKLVAEDFNGVPVESKDYGTSYLYDEVDSDASLEQRYSEDLNLGLPLTDTGKVD